METCLGCEEASGRNQGQLIDIQAGNESKSMWCVSFLFYLTPIKQKTIQQKLEVFR